MSARKEILKVIYHSDDETGMYRVGEIDFGIPMELTEYIKRYGQVGVNEILSILGHLAWEVKNVYFSLPKDVACDDVQEKPSI